MTIKKQKYGTYEMYIGVVHWRDTELVFLAYTWAEAYHTAASFIWAANSLGEQS